MNLEWLERRKERNREKERFRNVKQFNQFIILTLSFAAIAVGVYFCSMTIGAQSFSKSLDGGTWGCEKI